MLVSIANDVHQHARADASILVAWQHLNLANLHNTRIIE
jgi:hypothetical protein